MPHVVLSARNCGYVMSLMVKVTDLSPNFCLQEKIIIMGLKILKKKTQIKNYKEDDYLILSFYFLFSFNFPSSKDRSLACPKQKCLRWVLIIVFNIICVWFVKYIIN